MDRESLISQVREEYANITSNRAQQHFHQTSTEITLEAYYESLRDAVISEIGKGTFDNCRSGLEVVNKVAADKAILSDWETTRPDQNTTTKNGNE